MSHTTNQWNSIADDVVLGNDVRLSKFINLYGCRIGDESRIGACVEIQKGASIGRRCKISSHSFVCEGVTIEDDVFVGHGVMFINDRHPRATAANGAPQTEADWTLEHTLVRKGASIGTGAVIMSNLTIGEGALVGAGSVVTHSVPAGATVVGNPARILPAKPQPQDNAIPFLDLITPHKELEEELVARFRETLTTAHFVGGAAVEDFEQSFAAFCHTKYAIAVNSGTDALRLAILASGSAPGEVIVTTPHTFIATTEAITQAGMIVEFVDIDEKSYTLSPVALQRYFETECEQDATGHLVSKRSRKRIGAILPVHLYGQMAAMDALMALAERYDLRVIEDACQAHGAEYYSEKSQRWQRAGSVGLAAGFSFYPGKNLGACGEAGAITTNDAALAQKARQLRDHGQAKKYYHDSEGYNGRMDAIQAAFLHAKLPHLEQWNAQRRAHAEQYNQLLADKAQIITPSESEHARAVYHLYVVRTQQRDALIEFLKKEKIGTGIHYPIPLHLQKAYATLGYTKGDFPITERVASEIISLPLFPQLRNEQLERVVQAIEAFLSQKVK
jgi:dTDP-4-amino-4,6-dideoxygalactose transaminase/acetyltransferase-like isoleucine patch superfamily enzyme